MLLNKWKAEGYENPVTLCWLEILHAEGFKWTYKIFFGIKNKAYNTHGYG